MGADIFMMASLMPVGNQRLALPWRDQAMFPDHLYTCRGVLPRAEVIKA